MKRIRCSVCEPPDAVPCAGAWCETHGAGECDGTGPACVLRYDETCSLGLPDGNGGRVALVTATSAK
jgi:hypothetical protein